LFEHSAFLGVAGKLPNTDQNKYFILLSMVMEKKYKEARDLLNEMTEIWTNSIFPIIGEDYERVYVEFAEVSYLAEVAEVIDYRLNSEEPDGAKIIERIKATWDARFSQLFPIPSVLHGHLCVHSLVLSVKEQRVSFLEFFRVSLEHDRLEALDSVLEFCLANDDCDAYQIMKCRLMWARGQKDEAMSLIQQLPSSDETISLRSKWLLAKDAKPKRDTTSCRLHWATAPIPKSGRLGQRSTAHYI
jgi:FKBP12-rapamycin complex-associated protein